MIDLVHPVGHRLLPGEMAQQCSTWSGIIAMTTDIFVPPALTLTASNNSFSFALASTSPLRCQAFAQIKPYDQAPGKLWQTS